MRKSLFVVIVMMFVSIEQIKASGDWLDFDLGAGVGFNGGGGYGYEALLEYRFSKNTSLYITGNIMKNMKANYNDNAYHPNGYDMETGNSQMVGMQIRLWYFLAGYHRITRHDATSDVVKKATNSISFGLVYSKKEWEGGLLFYEYNDKARNGKNSSSVTYFIRKKFFF